MKYLLFTSLFIVTACDMQIKPDENSFLYSVPVGSELSLNQAVTIPANLARIHIQYGKQAKKSDIDLYYPHCELEIFKLHDQPTLITPDTFIIYKITDDDYEAKRYNLFASTGFSGGDMPFTGFATEYYLRSERQPDVYRLTCLHWGYEFDIDYLSIAEVRGALGDIFTLRLASAKQ